MKEAVVLINGYIIYLETLTGFSTYNADVPIVFNRDGRVLMFSKGNITYTALYNTYTNKFLYYAKAKDFWQNAIPDKKIFRADTNYSILGSNVFKASNVPIHLDPANIYGNGVAAGKGVENGTQVILIRENIIYESDIGYYTVEKRSFKFNDQISCDEEGENVTGNLCSNQNFESGIQHLTGYKTETFLKISINSEQYIRNYRSRVADKQYKNEQTGNYSFNFAEDAPMIEDISYIFFKILKNSILINYLQSPEINLFVLFEIHFNNINLQDPDSILPGHAQSFYHKSYTERYFNSLYVRLIEFYHWAKGVENNIYSLDKMDVRIRVLSLFTENEIAALSYDYKIALLEDILKTELIISGRWSFYNGTNLTEEELIVKLIRSFYREDAAGNPIYTEINSFLDYLASKPKYDQKSSKTLFEVLYRKIDDNVFLDKDKIGAKGKYIQAIYMLWAESKYNPNHSNSIIADSADALFHYTPYQAMSTPQGGEIAAPRIINYESTKTFLGFIDNYNFDFKTINGLHKIASIEKKSASAGSDAIRGYYHIYQPVIIKQTNGDDTIVRVPKENGATPIFYLMYVDQKGDSSDIITTAGVAVDIVLSFVGLSQYKSIGYLSKVSTFRKYLSGGLTAAEELLFINNLAKGFSAAQAVLEAAHSIYNFATDDCVIFQGQNPSNPGQNNPQYPLYNLCKHIDEWLSNVEMLTFSTDLLAQRTFKRATRRLISAIPAGDVYNDIRNAVENLGDLSDELDDFLIYLYNNYQSIYNIVILMSDKNKIDFMLDFAGKNDILDLLKVNIFLIHESWEKIIYLTNFRKDFNTLKRYREIVNNQWLQTHTNFGHTKFKNSGHGVSTGSSTGGHNVNNYVPPPPLVGGEISWKVPPPVKYTDPLDPDNSYSLGTIQRNLSDIVDPQTGTTWIGGSKPDGTRGGPLKNKTQNACWPKNYNIQRINEEKAVVLGTINVSTKPTDISNTGQYHYEIFATDGHPIKVIFDGDPNKGAILNNIFPSNDPELFHST